MASSAVLALHAPVRRLPWRWSLLLGAGVVVGLLVGFAVGLARPRVRR